MERLELLGRDLSVEDEVGRSGQGHFGEFLILARLKADRESIASLDIDLDRRCRSGQEVVNESAGGDSGAASEGFAFHTTLVGPDREMIGSENPDEVGIGALWLVVGMVANRGPIFDDIQAGQVRDEGDGVRDPGVQVVDGGTEGFNFHGRVHLKSEGLGHVDADLVANQLGGEGACDGLKGERITITTEKAGGVAAEAAGPVATHFRFAAIGIVVAESDVGTLFGRLHGEESIGSNPAMSVAKTSDLFTREALVEGTVVDDNEIVAGSIHFGERESHGENDLD